MTTPALSVEDVTREYQAKLAEAARRQYPNDVLLADWTAYSDESISDETRPSWESFKKHLAEWLGKSNTHLLTMTRKEAQQFINWFGKGEYEGRRKEGPPAPSYVLVHIQFAALVFKWLREVKGVIAVNPFADLAKNYAKKHKGALQTKLRAVNENDEALILEGAESLDDFTYGLLLLKTGVRRGEAARIKETDINWKARTIDIELHPRRTQPTAYFDEELEFFLRLKIERNHRRCPGNPYIFPSPKKKGHHLNGHTLGEQLKAMVKNSPLADKITDWNDSKQKVTSHTKRRGFTSILKRNGCPPHIVAALRGDSLRQRSELITEPTQGIYTYFDEIEGVDELRWWYNKCMPVIGAREIWARIAPRATSAMSMDGWIRARKN